MAELSAAGTNTTPRHDNVALGRRRRSGFGDAQGGRAKRFCQVALRDMSGLAVDAVHLTRPAEVSARLSNCWETLKGGWYQPGLVTDPGAGELETLDCGGEYTLRG